MAHLATRAGLPHWKFVPQYFNHIHFKREGILLINRGMFIAVEVYRSLVVSSACVSYWCVGVCVFGEVFPHTQYTHVALFIPVFVLCLLEVTMTTACPTDWGLVDH